MVVNSEVIDLTRGCRSVTSFRGPRGAGRDDGGARRPGNAGGSTRLEVMVAATAAVRMSRSRRSRPDAAVPHARDSAASRRDSRLRFPRPRAAPRRRSYPTSRSSSAMDVDINIYSAAVRVNSRLQRNLCSLRSSYFTLFPYSEEIEAFFGKKAYEAHWKKTH